MRLCFLLLLLVLVFETKVFFTFSNKYVFHHINAENNFKFSNTNENQMKIRTQNSRTVYVKMLREPAILYCVPKLKIRRNSKNEMENGKFSIKSSKTLIQLCGFITFLPRMCRVKALRRFRYFYTYSMSLCMCCVCEREKTH